MFRLVLKVSLKNLLTLVGSVVQLVIPFLRKEHFFQKLKSLSKI